MTTATLTTAKGTTYTAEVAYTVNGSKSAKRDAFAALAKVVKSAMDKKAAAQGKAIGTFALEMDRQRGDMIVTDATGIEHRARLVAKFAAAPKAPRTDRALVAAGGFAEGEHINGKTVKSLGKDWWMSEEQADGVAIPGRKDMTKGLRVQYAYFA